MAGSNRYATSGPTAQLDPREALALGMGIHEFAINALKRGVLSNGTERVDVQWEPSEADGALDINWTGTGGPAVSTPGHRDFGILLIGRQLSHEWHAKSTIESVAGGLTARMHLPRLAPHESKH